MGKNYVENSLKHFLKKKVKITLGFVVAFMISGTVGFAEVMENNTQLLNLQLLEVQEENNITENHDDIIVDKGTVLKVENNGTFINYGNLETKDTTAGVIGLEVTGDGVLYNYGDIITQKGRAIQTSNKEIHNYGILTGSWNVLALTSLEEVNVYNHENGQIIGTQYPISSWNGCKKISIYNDGYIQTSNAIAGGSGDDLKIYIYNTGTLKGNAATLLVGSKTKETYLENHGKVLGGALTLQDYITTTNLFYLDNYGFINSSGVITLRLNNKQESTEENIKNYGFIYDGINVIMNQTKTSLLNKGVIEGGVSGNGAGEKAINNSGIIIARNQDMSQFGWGTLNNSGAVLQREQNGSYTLLNSVDNAQNDEKIKNSGLIKEITGDTIDSSITEDNLFVNNKSVKLDLGNKITGKTITAVSQTAGNVVLDNSKDNGISGNEHLTLEDTTIIGYFEDEGTLLKVDGDLTLGENTFINTIAKRDEKGEFLVKSENIYAVDVNGIFTYTNEQINGNIKGGEKSVINVEGGSDINVLNNEIFGKGEINLNDGNWTKGENGSIILDGDKAVVNVDGNLVGYLAKEGDTTTKAGNTVLNTTLDGMITGTGTLNVDKIRFDMGDLKINDMEDTFTITGDKNIHVENALDKIDTSVIFNKEIKDGNVKLTLKSAQEMGIHNPEKQKLYNELIKNYGKDAETDEIIDKGTVEKIAELVGGIDKLIELMATSGVKITRDIAGAFTDSVNEFDKKANKGEWLTNAKYIGSDMEYDGTSTVNGYESDINSMVGMAEYGISDNTSLGFALGGGDTEIDLKELNGKSTSLDGNNYYAGVYAKHSVNGFDMTGSFGYTISDLDVKNGGSADSEAFTLAGYIKRDINLTDTVKLQPKLAFAYDYIMQDTAEMGKGMSVNSGDYHVFEADMGMNIVKEFAFNNGNLELKAGIKYSMTNVERNKEITGKYYEADVNLGSPEIDDTKGTAHIEFDYEHTTGFGVNGKYETMWSDSGDDSRITTGVSYRF